jgi:hypothetical protein
MPLTLLLPCLIVLEVLRYGTTYLSDRDSDGGGWFMLGVLLGTVALFPLSVLLFGLVVDILSGKRVVNWRAVRVVGSVALMSGSFYYLYAVRCVWSGRDAPQPYDVAKYQVYSAFLNDLGGRGLLIQSDTRALFEARDFPSPSVFVQPDARFQQAAQEAEEDYSRRFASTMPVERKFGLNKTYVLVSSDRIRQTNSLGYPCKDVEPGKLVALSPVGFNSDQTFAVLKADVLDGECISSNAGWSGFRMLRKQCGKWELVENLLFSDVAIN